jgi:thiamine biosynthesis lipoprotein
MDRRRFAIGLLVTAGLQPAARAADDRVQTEQRAVMGTWVRITVVHDAPRRRRQALDSAWRHLLERADMMSRYREGNALQALAAHAGRPGWQPVPTPLLQVLQMAQQASAFTDGAFDATVGAYRDWRFEPGSAPHVVDASTLQAQRAAVGWRALQVDTGRGAARLARAGMALDLGGIAKLPILQSTLQVLADNGIHDAMIDGGGDVLCRGQRLGRDWRVGIRDPLAPQRLLGVLDVRDGVVASSGDYERGFDQGGRRWHHVLDPATGWPTQGVRGVALLASDVQAVNGLGAAIMVAGPAAARTWLAQRPQVQALVAMPQDHWMTPGLAARLRPRAA